MLLNWARAIWWTGIARFDLILGFGFQRGKGIEVSRDRPNEIINLMRFMILFFTENWINKPMQRFGSDEKVNIEVGMHMNASSKEGRG